MIARIMCPRCNGHGHIWTGEDVKVCPVCKSDGTVPARNARGQFLKAEDSANKESTDV